MGAPKTIKATVGRAESSTVTHALLEVTNILFSTSTYIHRTLLMCSSDKSSILSQ